MEENRENQVVLPTHQTNPQSATLLPSPVAYAVSLATRSSCFAIRISSRVGAYGLEAAKVTTLSSLEVARGTVEGVLGRAGRDSILGSTSDLAAADTETILERSLETLHFAVAQAAFWTSAGFQLTGTTLSAASDISQLALLSLDNIFGSTDSSRAVASIITLIRREFQNPATGAQKQKVGMLDLVVGLGAFGYLQQSCRKSIREEARRQDREEIIWDVVVLNDGERIDIHEQSLSGEHKGAYTSRYGRKPVESPPSSPWQDGADDQEVLARLKSQITASLEPGTTVTISSSVSTTHTITVDVKGPAPLTLPALPGAEVVETRPVSASSSKIPLNLRDNDNSPSHRIVYKIEKNRLQNSSFVHDGDDTGGMQIVEITNKKPSNTLGLRIGPSSESSTSSSPEPSPRISSPTIKSPKSPPAHTRPKSRTNLNIKTAAASTQPLNNAANQKKPRSSVNRPTAAVPDRKSSRDLSIAKKPLPKKPSSPTTTKSTEKRGGLKQSISQIWSKDQNGEGTSTSSKRPQWKSPAGSGALEPMNTFKPPVLRGNGPAGQRAVVSRTGAHTPENIGRSASRTSHISVHDRRRDSIVSQSGSYAIDASGTLRPASPSLVRTEFAAHESVSKPRGDFSLTIPTSPKRGHRRTRSHVPSLYSLATNDSQTSLLLSSYFQKSAYNGSDALEKLRREGVVDGTFPTGNLLNNITRYMRFSSASYGSKFMKFMGIGTDMPAAKKWDETPTNVRHFLHHTESNANNMLLASFVDPQGGSDSTGSTETGLPLVHYISLDHEAKAVVLACRGTLGFEDVLTDLVCDYDRLAWRGRSYRVHKGVHASARRVLFGQDGRVLVTLREALSEFPDYGLVLCGHSLGGAVTSLLGVMLSEPNPNGTGFVTTYESASKLAGHPESEDRPVVGLPPGRRIQVYAYGPPGTMSRSLSKITKGLITSIVHGNDLVPHLSLGLLHDFQAVALAFRNDQNEARKEIRQRIWSTFQDTLLRRPSSSLALVEDETQWMQEALDALRESMKGEKLMPPGEVFTIETQNVLRRDAFLFANEDHIGRPAQRIVLKYIRDVEGRFGEMRFGRSMLLDHSPGKYEEALNKLRLGVAE